MKKWISALLCLVLLLGLTGCAAPSAIPKPSDKLQVTIEMGGQTVAVDESLDQSSLDAKDFTTDAATGRISSLSRTAYTGVDVSSHQGAIDWSAVAGDGIDFAILRIGNRGYSQGALSLDEQFEANYTGAKENGLKTGVYFFSQAVSVEEAQAEAAFVLAALNGRQLDLPVVFDWETIDTDDARTDGVDSQTATACCLAFCAAIQEAGYDAAFYCNGMLGYLQYDLSQLQELDAWYAEYSDFPGFAYAFRLWQYSKTGTVAGISGDVDLNLWFPE